MKQPLGLFRTLLLLSLVDISLRLFGYARVMRAARRFFPKREARAAEHTIAATMRTLITATALYPGRSQCLEQSVTAFMLLRRQGFDVSVRLGVQPYPFSAHAWLELNGAPLTETPEAISNFALLPEIAS